MGPAPFPGPRVLEQFLGLLLLLLFLFIFIYSPIHFEGEAHIGVRRQLAGVSCFLLPCGFWESNPDSWV